MLLLCNERSLRTLRTDYLFEFRCASLVTHMHAMGVPSEETIYLASKADRFRWALKIQGECRLGMSNFGIRFYNILRLMAKDKTKFWGDDISFTLLPVPTD